MALGCLPLFRRAARTAKKEDEERFDPSEEIEPPSRSLSTISSGFITTISRKDSGLTSVSNSTMSSMRCVSVTFNPTVDEVVFDKNDAPCSVRKSLDGCKDRLTRSNTSPVVVQATFGNIIKHPQNLVITLSSSQKLGPHQSSSPHSSLKYPPAPSINILPSRSRSDTSHASQRHRTERRHLVSNVH